MTVQAIEGSRVRVNVEAAAVSARALAVVGKVTEVGEAASEWLDRRVLVPAMTSCGECDFCRRGAPHGCADRVLLQATDGVPSEVVSGARFLTGVDGELAVDGPCAAVLGSEGLRAYAAYCALGVAPAEPVVVVGDGTRSELLRQIGAAKSAAVCTLELAQSDSAHKPWRGFALDGNAEALLEALTPGSGLAISSDDPELTGVLPLATLCERGIHVSFVGAPHPDLLPELVALAARRELDLEAACTVLASGASQSAINDAIASGRCAIVPA